MYAFKFKHIRWKNFLSTGNQYTELALDQDSSTLVYGKNGSGKSTILDALCFCLYGRPFRRIKKEKLVNAVNGANCRVEVEGESYGRQYKIVRGLKPNVFEIWIDGVQLNQSAAVKDQQEYLTRTILHMDMKAATQLIILGSASYVQFMQLKPDIRREVIEDLLDIKVFSGMASNLKSKMTELREQVLTNEKDKAHLQSILKIHEDNAVASGRIREAEIMDLHRDLNLANVELSTQRLKERSVVDEIDRMVRILGPDTHLTHKLAELSKMKLTLESKLKAAQESQDFFYTEERCPTCSQRIDDAIKDVKIEDFASVIHKHKWSMTKLEEAIKKAQEDHSKYNEGLVEIDERRQVLTKQSMRVQMEEYKVKQIEDRIAALTNAAPVALVSDQELADLKLGLQGCTVLEKMYSEKKELYEVAQVILRDSGIKAKIVKQYIPIINALVNKYLVAMDFFVKFELNENFEEKIYSRHRDEFEYDSFSEGEKCRINVALLLAWRDIAKMKNSINSNLLIMDEIFDGAADFDGIDDILELLNNMADSNVFVISPKGDSMVDKFKTSVRMEKHGNFSRKSK